MTGWKKREIIELREGDVVRFNLRTRMRWVVELPNSWCTTIINQYGTRRCFIDDNRLRKLWIQPARDEWRLPDGTLMFNKFGNP